MDSLWIFVQVITAAAFISSTIIILKNFIIPTTPSSSSSNSFTSSNNPSLPSGSLGLPFVGETLHFVSSAYSHRPDTFMDTRRRRQQVTDEVIAHNMIDMMIPGQDSVPILITLAIKYLSDSPSALQQLTEENMELKRQKTQLGEPLKWTDYLSLPFTQNVITETLRLGNIITGVMRKAMKDIEIKGYLIPKGWCVLAYIRSVHVDENHFESPYHFNPWRWQGKDSNNLNFTPFGGGQRLCPGLELARLEASIFLHHFITEFRLTK
ncbi:3-epi-6-deoxocathasterone 23-monooxygenase-like [Cucumis melo var. makuwa]|uniref:3-epi-6-deoxocathasterone 23-monooxygenase-like n=1 Tax=Cucumis melo var. makuwa TaxID=1194695 RepID=A0A5D3BZX0_CUCMM|nr:3-epi-6-deoxocathasterone 23-monooxygenase-like [Cucumis melo var. makuwa]